ncbi:hypothetical protein, partial [Hyalangium sp.]|uniref:hypothetical protein n=1 Tax=Hyalangium sp. TaxID=2028555 RepID=UPI002D691056
MHALVWLVLAARARDPSEKPPSSPPITLELVEVEVTPPAPKPPKPPPAPPPKPEPSRPPRPAPKPIVEASPPTP